MKKLSNTEPELKKKNISYEKSYSKPLNRNSKLITYNIKLKST